MEHTPHKVQSRLLMGRKCPIKTCSIDTAVSPFRVNCSEKTPDQIYSTALGDLRSMLESLSKRIFSVNKKMAKLGPVKKKLSAPVGGSPSLKKVSVKNLINFKLNSIERKSDHLDFKLTDLKHQKNTVLKDFESIQKELEKVTIMNKKIAISKSLISTTSKQLKGHPHQVYHHKSKFLVSEICSQVISHSSYISDKKKNITELEKNIKSYENKILLKQNRLKKLSQNFADKRDQLDKKNPELGELERELNIKYWNICEQLTKIDTRLTELYRTSDKAEAALSNNLCM